MALKSDFHFRLDTQCLKWSEVNLGGKQAPATAAWQELDQFEVLQVNKYIRLA